MIRAQLPAYSPLSLGSWTRALGLAGLSPEEARDRLRADLMAEFGADAVILTDSGTHALELALRVGAGPHPGPGAVALPGYSCFDLATAAVGAGVPVSFYDVDPHSLTPDLDQVASALDAGTRVVVVSNLFGYPVDWDAVGGLCESAGALLVEDAAQGLGSSWQGRPGGSFGAMTVLSFGRGKGWTGGGGGALLLRHAESVGQARGLPHRARPGWRAAGRSAVLSLAQWALGRPWLYGLPSAVPWLRLGETTYKEPSTVQDISPFSAGLASATRDSARAEAALRKKTAETLRGRISSRVPPGFLRFPDPVPGGEASFLRAPLLLSSGADGFLGLKGVRRLGVARGYHETLNRIPQLSVLSGRVSGSFPGADSLARNLVTLPTHSLLSDADLDRIAALFL